MRDAGIHGVLPEISRLSIRVRPISQDRYRGLPLNKGRDLKTLVARVFDGTAEINSGNEMHAER